VYVCCKQIENITYEIKDKLVELSLKKKIQGGF